MSRGGKRPGAGRPLGSTNRWDRQLREELAKTGLLPVEYMIDVMRGAEEKDELDAKGRYVRTYYADKFGDEITPARRDAMAMAAAPYLHHRLATLTLEGNPENPVVARIQEGMTADEAARTYMQTLRGTGTSGVPRFRLIKGDKK
jgi:hypothetical protein